MYQLDKKEQHILNGIIKTLYMQKTIELVENFVQDCGCEPKTAYKRVFDEIFRILNEAKNSVDAYLSERKANNKIKDEKQALKSIAGNAFSQAILYIFLKNKEAGNINPNIFITSQKSKVPSFDEIAVINVDGEAQKPDCDLVIYSLNKDKLLKKCMIVSVKTSVRERAKQTCIWKLLMEIASSDNSLKEKYNISYNPKEMPLVCFATVNFYNEINNPQHRGMFKFFDQAFIAKNIDADFISRMSNFPDFVNEAL
jgi:type II restriction enzyme